LKSQPFIFGLLALIYWIGQSFDSPGASFHNVSFLDTVPNTSIKTPLSPVPSNLINKGLVRTDTLGKKGLKKDSVKLKSEEGEVNSEVEYSSKDSTAFDIAGKKVYLYKDAVVKYDDIVLKAGFIEMDQGDLTIYAKGIYDTAHVYSQKPEVTQGTNKITADSLRYNLKSKKTVGWELVTGEGGGFIRGAKVKLDEKKEGFLKNGIYTTCNLDHPHYGIIITRAKINQNTIVTGPAYFFIEDVPLPFILPFGFFPKTESRANGILFPRIGEDQALGFFLQDFGYYQGLGENFDAQLKASIYTKGSFGFSIDSRYNFIYKSTGTFSFRFMDRKTGDKGTSDFSDSKDFNISWSHSQSEKAHPGTNFSASVNAASTSFYNNSTISYSPTYRAQNQVGSSINYSRIWEGSPWSLNIGFTHSQNLAQKLITITFPTLNIALSRINPFDSKERVGTQKWYQKIGFSYTLSAQNSLNNITTSQLFSKGFTKLLQNGIIHQPSIGLGTYTVLKHLLISPGFNYTERWYFQTYRQRYNFTNRNYDSDTIQGFRAERDFSFGISTDTHIYGILQFQHGAIKAIRHVIEPQIGFSYTPDFSKLSPNNYGSYHNFTTGQNTTYSIFSGGLYGGGPIGRSEAITININNTLELKVKSKKDTVKGEQKIPIFENLSINTSYNLAADSFRLQPISVTGGTTLFKKVGINFRAGFDPYATDQFGNKIKEFLYTKTRQLVRLTDFSISANISLNSNSNTGSIQKPQPKNQSNGFNVHPLESEYVDFKVPWDININYNFNYSVGPGSSISNTSKTISRSNVVNITGNFSLTPKWKIGYTTGVDFVQQNITSTQFTVFRDLHCWQFSASWSPFGATKFYSVELRVASGVLSDLKLDKRKDYYDNY